MALIVYTYNGTALNDGSTWRTAVPVVLNPNLVAEAKPNMIPMSYGKEPDYVGKVLQERHLTLRITYLGASTISVAHQTLEILFDPQDVTMRVLVFKDSVDDKQYSVRATALRIGDPNGKTVDVELVIKSPTLTAVTPITETDWEITTSPDTYVLNIDEGDFEVYPVYTITPNTAKVAAGYGYRRYVQMYNYTTKSAGSYGIDIAEAGFDTRVAAAAGGPIADSDNHCHLTADVAADAITFPYGTVTGALPATGMGYIGTEQVAWSAKTGTTSGNLTITKHAVGGTTAATHASGDILYLSRMMVNCDDVDVSIGEAAGTITHIPRWIYPLNSASSRIWISYDFAPRSLGTLLTAIDDNDTSMTLTNMENAASIPTSSGCFLIETEVVAYDTFSSSTGIATSLARGERGTSAAAHAAGVAIRWIPDIQIRYGNYNATTPTDSTVSQPLFNLTTSTNSALVYDTFYSQLYGVGWIPTGNVSFGGDRSAYTFSTEDDWAGTTLTDPAVCMGMACSAAKATAYWNYENPFGFTSIVWTTVDRHFLPAGTGVLETGLNKSTWESTAIASTTTTKATTASITTTPSAPPHFYARAFIKNNTTTRFAHTAAVDISQVTVNLSTSTTASTYGIPFVSMSAEEAITYDMDAILQNDTTGEWIHIKASLAVTYSIIIDTLNKTVKYSKDNRNLFGAITDFSSVRAQWLRATLGNNTMSYTEAGLTSLTCVITWQARKK